MANKVSVKVGSEFNKKGIEQAKSGLGELDGKTKSSGASIAAGMAVATAAVAAVGIAIKKTVEALGDLVNASAEQELVEKRLEIAVRNNPLLSGEAAGSLVEYAAALQKVSTFGDEAIIQQAQFLASMSLTEQQIRDVLDVAVDFASTGVVSLDSAVRNIAKTFGGLTGELGELIPELKDLTTEELEQGGAVDILREKYAGMAEEMASTTAGEMQQFENAWGDLKEVAGSFLADVLTPIVDTLTAMVSAVNEAVTALRNMRNEFAQFEGQQPDIKLVDLRLSTPEDISQALESAMGTGSPFDDLFKQMAEIAERAAAAGESTKELDDAIKNLTTDQKLELEAIQTLTKEFGFIDEQAAKWGETIDATAEKNKLFGQVISTLHTADFRDYGNAIQRLIALFDDDLSPAVEKVVEYVKGIGVHKEGTPKIEPFDPAERGITGGVWGPPGEAPAIVDYSHMVPEVPEVPEPFVELDTVVNTLSSSIGGTAGELAKMAATSGMAGVAMFALGKVMDGVMSVLGPSIDMVLDPLISMLRAVGEVIGALLIPVFQAIQPVIDMLVDKFVWLYNNALVPVGNILILLMTVINWVSDQMRTAIHNVIEFILHPFNENNRDNWEYDTWKEFKKQANYFSNKLEKIVREDLESGGKFDYDDDSGAGTGGDSVYGGSMTVQRVPDIYVYNTYNGVFIGEGGKADMGQFMVECIQEYVGGGGTVEFAEGAA